MDFSGSSPMNFLDAFQKVAIKCIINVSQRYELPALRFRYMKIDNKFFILIRIDLVRNTFQ